MRQGSHRPRYRDASLQLCRAHGSNPMEGYGRQDGTEGGTGAVTDVQTPLRKPGVAEEALCVHSPQRQHGSDQHVHEHTHAHTSCQVWSQKQASVPSAPLLRSLAQGRTRCVACCCRNPSPCSTRRGGLREKEFQGSRGGGGGGLESGHAGGTAAVCKPDTLAQLAPHLR